VQPPDQFSEAGHQGVVQGFAEADADPVGGCPGQGGGQIGLMVKVVPDLQVIGGGLDGGLVDDAIALEGVHVADPHPPVRFGYREEQ
jgi:hypothetical protein